MIFIFKISEIKAIFEKIKNNEYVSRLLRFVKNNKIFVSVTSVCSVGVLVFVCLVLFAGLRVGINVNYSGKNIAVVENDYIGRSALGIAANSVTGDAQAAIEVPEYSLTLTAADKLESANQVADSIIENTKDITYGWALKIGGKTVIHVKEEGIEELLKARKAAFFVDGAENSAKFAEKVEVEEGYYLNSEFSDFKKAEKIINKLEVETISSVKTNIATPYKTVKRTNSEKPAGYSAVAVKGENGITVRTESVKKINGKVVSRKQTSIVTEKKAVDQIIEIGTKVKRASVNSGFISPISAGKYRISSYFGDGRNHKGIDMCAPRGTAIFAVGGGTVSYAGYDSDFGYNVIIRHSNGISTRYAHANSLNVSVGQIVAQGDIIASVGCTGWSTGNHLHFEVIANGVRVNPAPYIGI